MLKKCKACGNDVAKGAKKCPHCNQRLKRGLFFKLFIVIIILFSIQILWNFGSAVKTDYDKAATKHKITMKK